MGDSDQRRPGGFGQQFLLNLLVFVMVFLLVALGFAGGVAAMWWRGPQIRRLVATVLPQAIDPDTQRSREERIEILWEIWSILDREFLDPAEMDDQKMVHGAAAGLVAAIGDPPTMFVEPLRAAILESNIQGSFEGIGATVDLTTTGVLLVSFLPGSAAEQAGLKAGDVIIAVDDVPLKGKTLIEATSLIRGPSGTVVRLLVQRQGVDEPFLVPVTRRRVDLPVVEARMLEGQVAYLRLTEFNAVALRRVQPELEKLLSQNPVGLVFDLRNNPGGYLHMAVDIASQFLPRDTLVLTDRERSREPREYRVKQPGLALDIPLVVLVNGGSASASEIVAGAIQDYGRGVLVGESTYGKGSVQNTHTLSDGSSLRVTTARWYLPNGRNLDEEGGLQPDIVVPLTADDVNARRDPQLDRAMEYLLKGQ